MVLVFRGENQGSKGEACNTWSPPHADVHVHQPEWDHQIFKAHGREMVVESFDNLQLGFIKRQGFIKNKVMVWLVVANVEKVS